jgi:hypothetical protein
MSAIARDVTGMFLGASALVFDGGCDPEIMEAAACREGVALANDLLLHRVRMASDCASAVRTIKGEELMGPYGQIVREMKRSVQDFAFLSWCMRIGDPTPMLTT